MRKKRDPQPGGRRQVGWSRKPERLTLPGLGWRLDSVIRVGRSVDEALEDLRKLWEEHENPAALLDAVWLCTEGSTEPMPMPRWVSRSVTGWLKSGRFPELLKAHDQDLCELGWLDWFQLAHAHKLSDREARNLVVDINGLVGADARRRAATTAIVKRAIAKVQAQAKKNPGRYYAGRADGDWWYRLPDGEAWTRVWEKHTAVLRQRRPGAFLFGIPRARVRIKLAR
jgi:hypothetical protein